MFCSTYDVDMPLLLADAYGTTFSRKIQTTPPIAAKNKTERKKQSSLGAGAPSATDTSVRVNQTRGEKTGNYEIHITIDRHDCHLLCLFIGVFTLSVLFNSNKRNGPASLAG